MKQLILAVLLLIPSISFGIDPSISPSTPVICDKPIEREDGTPLATNEIAWIKLYRDDGTGKALVDQSVECSFVIDNTILPDNSYIYNVTATDLGDRESTYSNDVLHQIQRVTPPKPPTLHSPAATGG